jgi:pilus assembly protein CpaF
MMVGMAGFQLPMWIIRRQITSALQIVVQVARLAGGARKVVKISEITGMDEDVISMQDLFVFKQTGLDVEQTARRSFHRRRNSVPGDRSRSARSRPRTATPRCGGSPPS